MLFFYYYSFHAIMTKMSFKISNSLKIILWSFLEKIYFDINILFIFLRITYKIN